MSHAGRLLLVVAAVAALTATSGCGGAGSGVLAPSARAATVCDRFVAPHGDDRAAGTAKHPWRSAQRLVRGLRSGQRGCLRAGTYRGDVAVGRSRVVLSSAPGERARVVGRVWIQRQASHVAVIDLDLDGRNARGLPSPTVNGDAAQFLRLDVTNDRSGVCFLIGSGYGRADDTVIRWSRIHGCGVLPAVNRQHGIYVDTAVGTQILDNVIYDNADRGIQLYPDAQRTTIRGNVIDGNGEGVIFSGDGRTASSDTLVEGNAITGARIRANVESWYPTGAAQGRGNRVVGNCLEGGTPAIDVSGGGFAASDNVVAAPLYKDRLSHDFRIGAASPCAAVLRASAAPAGPQGQPPVSGR
ncbi:hypothetical protein DSM104299_04754 [Baekduia alba]|uniref:right-handed parallel beta-helix repeat-containing protein n=1 Tax=Baekduia alba TaxID=2997333 RepID=UPI0023422526|nr:right-handed parallel beta-helix repeat-containing protein [Baekduia alba]WCB96000.1 hypothetical protein DSM104299_04754 [Baekduia alba]